MFTDGSRLDSGAAGYAVTWQNGQRWVGIKTYMGLQPGSLRCGVRRPRHGTGNCRKATDNTGEGHHIHRRPGRRQAHGLGGAGRPWGGMATAL
jgi:hypothetical protein